MKLCILLAMLICIANAAVPSVYKAWWAKRVESDDYLTSGRLNERQIKYASEAGFKSIVSMFTYNKEVKKDTYTIPSTSSARYIAETLSGLSYDTVLDSEPSDAWKSQDAVQKFQHLARNHPKPMLLHCNDAYAASFIVLAYFANVTANDDVQAREGRVTAADVFRIGARLGYDYSEDPKLREIISGITGSRVTDYPKPNVQVGDWYDHYWLMKLLYKNWFIAGQVQTDHLTALSEAGVKGIVNARIGVEVDGEPSQEEVTLLNIEDETGTYTGNGRQTTVELVKNRIDPNKTNEYISSVSTVNYETRNPLEFGDDIGYNETLQSVTLQEKLPGVKYVHAPIGGKFTYNITMWNYFKDSVTALNSNDLILVHCGTSFRAAVTGLLSAAYTNCFDSSWALERTRELGFRYDVDKPDVLDLFSQALDNRTDLEQCVKDRDRTTTTQKPDAGTAPNVVSSYLVAVIAFICIMIYN